MAFHLVVVITTYVYNGDQCTLMEAHPYITIDAPKIPWKIQMQIPKWKQQKEKELGHALKLGTLIR